MASTANEGKKFLENEEIRLKNKEIEDKKAADELEKK